MANKASITVKILGSNGKTSKRRAFRTAEGAAEFITKELGTGWVVRRVGGEATAHSTDGVHGAFTAATNGIDMSDVYMKLHGLEFVADLGTPVSEFSHTESTVVEVETVAEELEVHPALMSTSDASPEEVAFHREHEAAQAVRDGVAPVSEPEAVGVEAAKPAAAPKGPKAYKAPCGRQGTGRLSELFHAIRSAGIAANRSLRGKDMAKALAKEYDMWTRTKYFDKLLGFVATPGSKSADGHYDLYIGSFPGASTQELTSKLYEAIEAAGFEVGEVVKGEFPKVTVIDAKVSA